MPSRWQHVRDLFETVYELDPAERDRHLSAACADDPSMRDEIDSLLSAHRSAAALLDQPLFSPLQAVERNHDGVESFVGRRVGAYELTRHIGSGGMGHVFLARRADDQFDKTVAVKLIRPDIFTPVAVRRFQHERQALAMFEHPHVARLLDGGVTDGDTPYLVMEYVDGVPITRFCRERGLGVAGRLALFLQVCDAVQHAHENLIVHCDLKPGNISVTADGNCKLLDFSIARMLNRPAGEEPAQTATGCRLLTPQYASPEQIRGEPVTTRTDIYLLGLVLYELLAGVPPFGHGPSPIYAVERAVCEDDPPPPSAALRRAAAGTDGPSNSRALAVTRRRLRGDLDAIVLMALRKAPERRYRSVEQLAGDIRRHLDGLPITARPQTAVYRLTRFVRRHRWPVALATAAGLALAGGAVTTAWQYRAASTQRDRALRAQDDAGRHARKAQAEARRTDEVLRFFQTMLAKADPAEGGAGLTVLEVLDAASAGIAQEFGANPDLELAIRSAIGSTYMGLGRYDKAEEHLVRTLELAEKAGSDGAADQARAHRDLSVLYYHMQAFEPAEAHARTALGLDRRNKPESDELVAQDLNNLATIRRARGDIEEAHRLLLEALAIRQRVHGDASVMTAESLNNLANIHRLRGDLAGAEKLCRRVVDIRRRAIGAAHPSTAAAMDNLAVILMQQKQYEEAGHLLEDAVGALRACYPDGHPDLAITLTNLASFHRLHGRFEPAAPLAREALAIRLRHFPETARPVSHARVTLAEILIGLQQQEEARALLHLARDACRTERNCEPPLVERIADNLRSLGDS